MWFGIILIVAGVLLLLQNLGILSSDVWSVLWPVVIIAFGLSLVLKTFKKDK